MSIPGHRITRRAFAARLAGSAGVLGLAVLGAPRVTMARAQAGSTAAIPVRLGEIVQAGVDFRGGLAEGVRLPRAGGDSWTLTAERPGGRFTSEPLRLDFACSHVGVHWRAEGPSGMLSVEVRSSRDGERWSSWRRVLAESHGREGATDETFGSLVGGRLGLWLQYRLTFAEAPEGSRETAAVEQVALTYLDARGLADRMGPGPLRQVAQTGFKGGKDAFVARVVTREQWGADESIRFADGREQWPRAFVAPKLLVVHHTATENEYADPAAEVRAIYTYHTVTQGFGDIGYHLLIDDRGQVYEGRRGRESEPSGDPAREVLSPDVVAGHALNYNYGSVGIALLGTFGALSADDPRTLAATEPSEAALTTLEEALAFEAARHGIDPTERIAFLRGAGLEDFLWRDDLAAVSGHRDCVPTECPGQNLYTRLPELRARVAARLGPPGPRARITRGPEERSPWPTDLAFAWEGYDGATEFSARLEGWRRDGPDLIVPLSGLTADQRPLWSPWSRERAAGFALPPDARGSYTLHVRARAAGGREGLYDARWPLYVDRHVLADNADPLTIRHGIWRRTGEVLGFNGADYDEAEPLGSPSSFGWTLDVPESGTYRVLACWTSGPLRASNAEFMIASVAPEGAALGEFDVEVDQRERGGQWVELARVDLYAGGTCFVELTNAADGVVVADAIRIVLV